MSSPAPTLRGQAGLQRPAPVRVLHVITHLDHGGAQTNTLLSVAGMDRARYRVDVAAGPGALEAQAAEAADRLIVLPRLRRSLWSPGDLAVAVALWRLLGAYDLVHTHGSKAGVLGRLVGRLRGVPVVVHTIHGFPVHDRMGNLRRSLLLGLERLVARCSDRILCVCQANATEALGLGIARADQLRVVVSGVPTETLLSSSGARVRQELGIPADAPVVGTVTRLMEQKAPLDFVAAAHRVVEAVPDAHVLLVGEGPLRPQVEAAAAEVPRLHLLGYRTDVPDLLAAMDVVAFSSLWEGLGRALTEAVLVGKPVVATSVNGVPELVASGETGWLTQAGRPDELSERILDLLARPDRGAGMGALGAARVAGRYDTAEMIDGLDWVYQEALGERLP